MLPLYVYRGTTRLFQLSRPHNYVLKTLAGSLPVQLRYFESNSTLYKGQFNTTTTTNSTTGNGTCKAQQRHEIFENVLEKKRLLQEKKDVIVKDIRETRTKVKERVEEIIERENVMTIPNILCVARGVLSPYIGYTIICSDYSLAMGLLVFAGITDVADGYIARTWPSQASKMGSFLDPMADKLLMGSLVISLTYADLLPLWLTGMILFRDLFLIGAGFVIRFKSLPPPRTLSRYFDVTHATVQLAPTFISKINTGIQLGTVFITLGAPIWNYVDHPYLHGLWYLTGITTALAALSYVISKDTYRYLKKR